MATPRATEAKAKKKPNTPKDKSTTKDGNPPQSATIAPDNTGRVGRAKTQWQPGTTGNPVGRPKGSRTRFAEKVLGAYERVWDMPMPADEAEAKAMARNLPLGERALLATARLNPEGLVQQAVKLVPKEVDLGDNSAAAFGKLWEMLGHGKLPKKGDGNGSDK